MSRTVVVLVVTFLALLGTARAEVPAADERSPAVAGLVGVSGPLVGIAITAVGMSDLVDSNRTGLAMFAVGATSFLVTPTLAHTYAGRTWSLALGVKLVSAGVMGLGALGNLGTTNNGITVPALVGVGAIGVVGATIVEIATAPSVARDHNQQQRELSVAPLVTRDGGLLVLGGRF